MGAYRMPVRRTVASRVQSIEGGMKGMVLDARGALWIEDYAKESGDEARAWAVYTGGKRPRAAIVMESWRAAIADYNGTNCAPLPQSLHYPVRDAAAVHTFREIDRAVAAGKKMGRSWQGKLPTQSDWGYLQRHIRQTMENAFLSLGWRNAIYDPKEDDHGSRDYWYRKQESLMCHAGVYWSLGKGAVGASIGPNVTAELTVSLEWFRRVYARGVATPYVGELHERTLVLDAGEPDATGALPCTALWRPDVLVNYVTVRQGTIRDGVLLFDDALRMVPDPIRVDRRFSGHYDAA